MTTSSRSVPLAAVAVLIGGLGFAAGAVTAADAGPKPVTKAQVKKIAKKQANKAITQRAPRLTVKRATTADDAARLAGQSITTFDVTVPPDGAPQTVATMNGLSLVASCPGSQPTLKVTAPGAGEIVYWRSDGGSGKSSNNPLNLSISGPGYGGLSQTLIRRPGAEPVTAQVGWATDPALLHCVLMGSVASR